MAGAGRVRSTIPLGSADNAMASRMTTVATIAAFIGLGGLLAFAVVNRLSFYAVDSGSMAPAIATGSLVIDEPIDLASALAPGDVITFDLGSGHITTHRIVELTAAGIVTKGDANRAPDLTLITDGQIRGRVIAVIPVVGGVTGIARQPLLVAGLVGAIVVLLVWDRLRDRWHREPIPPEGDAP